MPEVFPEVVVNHSAETAHSVDQDLINAATVIARVARRANRHPKTADVMLSMADHLRREAFALREPGALAHRGYDLTVCRCEGGPYLGARKAGTPCCCERCGFITEDQRAVIVEGNDRMHRALQQAKDRSLLRLEMRLAELTSSPGQATS